MAFLHMRIQKRTEQHLSFRFSESKIPLLLVFKISSFLAFSVIVQVGLYVSDLVWNPKTFFSIAAKTAEDPKIVTRQLS